MAAGYQPASQRNPPKVKPVCKFTEINTQKTYKHKYKKYINKMRGKDKSGKRAPQGSGWCQLSWGFRPHPRIPKVSLLRRQMPESNSSDRRSYVDFGRDSAGSAAVHYLTKGWKPALELLLWRSPARQQLEAFWGQDQDSQFQTFCQLCHFVNFVHFVHLCRLPRLSPILKSRANIGKFPSSFTSRGRFFLKISSDSSSNLKVWQLRDFFEIQIDSWNGQYLSNIS